MFQDQIQERIDQRIKGLQLLGDDDLEVVSKELGMPVSEVKLMIKRATGIGEQFQQKSLKENPEMFKDLLEMMTKEELSEFEDLMAQTKAFKLPGGPKRRKRREQRARGTDTLMGSNMRLEDITEMVKTMNKEQLAEFEAMMHEARKEEDQALAEALAYFDIPEEYREKALEGRKFSPEFSELADRAWNMAQKQQQKNKDERILDLLLVALKGNMNSQAIGPGHPAYDLFTSDGLNDEKSPGTKFKERQQKSEIEIGSKYRSVYDAFTSAHLNGGQPTMSTVSTKEEKSRLEKLQEMRDGAYAQFDHSEQRQEGDVVQLPAGFQDQGTRDGWRSYSRGDKKELEITLARTGNPLYDRFTSRKLNAVDGETEFDQPS